MILVLFLSTFFSLPGSLALTSRAVQPLAPLMTDFVWYPKFVVTGDSPNFTAQWSGGTPPYTVSWNFGDGQTGNGPQVFHKFNSPANYTVTVTVTDSLGLTSSRAHGVKVQAWPINIFGWVVRWNITANDGINIWNVTYHGTLVIRDVRLTAIQVLYSPAPSGQPFCGPFYDEPFNETGVRADGNIFYENSTNPLNPYFQLRAEYRVEGYYYQEAYRFYPTGRWNTEFIAARGGCAFDHIYEPHWRFSLATGNYTQDLLSTYTPSGAWQDLIWEGNYTDNGFRDASHNSTQWRFGANGMYYYITPTIVRADLDLPDLSSNLILVRARPNEIELSHPLVGIENPIEFVNGELAFRRNIAFWFIPRVWDHGPVNAAPPKDITLSFYPYGSWP